MPKKRGFAAMSKKQHLKLSAKGGYTKTEKGFAKTGDAREMAKKRWEKHREKQRQERVGEVQKELPEDSEELEG